MEHHITLVLTLVMLLGIGAQWIAWRLAVPAIILLTLFGVVAGPVLGLIQPRRDLGEMLDPMIKLGVAVILFEGGLSLRFHEFRQAASGVTRLVSVGVLIAFGLGSTAAYYIGDLSWPVALIFGAITVVTGPTVIIPLLRQARLRRRPASFLKWEGIINDPTGALLAVVIFEYFAVVGTGSMESMALRVIGGLLFSFACGIGPGYLLGTVFRRGQVPEYLKGPLALATALAVYVLSNQILSESGLLAATLLGITLGNMNLPSIEELRRFKEYVALMLVSGVFILLTAELDPAILLRLDWRTVALLATIVFVARPLTIWLSTIGAGMSWQERALLGWIAPRGIVAASVAAVFGPALVTQGYAGAELLLPLIFALILITVVLHGLSINWLARRLDLGAPTTSGLLIVGASPWTIGLAEILKKLEIPTLIVDNEWSRIRSARQGGLNVFYGDILSEASEQRLEFNDFGYLFAATENDAYNAHVCTHYAAEMGRNHTFQLPQANTDLPDPRRVTVNRRGLIAIGSNAQYDALIASWYRGHVFQHIELSDHLSYDDFRATCRDCRIILLARLDGALQIESTEQPLNPKVGDTVVFFGPIFELPAPAETETGVG